MLDAVFLESIIKSKNGSYHWELNRKNKGRVTGFLEWFCIAHDILHKLHVSVDHELFICFAVCITIFSFFLIFEITFNLQKVLHIWHCVHFYLLVGLLLSFVFWLFQITSTPILPFASVILWKSRISNASWMLLKGMVFTLRRYLIRIQ
jgi:hypothetical protein